MNPMVRKKFLYQSDVRDLTIYSRRWAGVVVDVIRNIDHDQANDVMAAIDAMYAAGVHAGRQQITDAVHREMARSIET